MKLFPLIPSSPFFHAFYVAREVPAAVADISNPDNGPET